MRSITTIPSLVLFFFFFGGTPGTPTNVKPQADPGLRLADSTVASWVAAEKVPGAVLLVSRRGKTVLKVAYGSARLFKYQAHPGNSAIPGSLRRLNKPEPMTAVKVFDLASVTKVMATTMAIMMLVDRGQVYLDSPVSTYLPDFSGAEKEHITVRHLLTHRSGLPQWLPIYYHAGNTEDAYDYIRRLQLAWPIGLQRHYSDLGFMLLGLIVEQVSRNPLDTFLDNELYTPLGLSSTGFQPTGARDEAKDDGAFAATSHGNPYEHRMIYDPAFGYRI
jgi:CubicO group peptidase (beta-lactamase class C family)